jgi:hypothetical protein
MPADRAAGPKTLAEFRETVSGPKLPAGLDAPLQALWHDARGDWARAHRIAMDAKGGDGAWVHAYLHRKEGDLDNARYWYRKAKRPEATGALEKEWAAIAAALLEHG